MRKSTWVGVLLGLVLIVAGFALAGCNSDPQDGSPCTHAGDVWAKGGTTLKCQPGFRGQLYWTKVKAVPRAVPRPAPQPRAR